MPVKRHIKILGVAATAVLFLSGCVAPTTQRAVLDEKAVAQESQKQKRLALQLEKERRERLDKVSVPLLINAVPLCEGRMVRAYGMRVANLFSYGKDFYAAVKEEYGWDEYVRVSQLTEEFPAQRAGLQVGDRLLTINGKKVPVGKKAAERTQKMLKKSAEQDGADQLRILRGTQESSISIAAPRQLCASAVSLVNNDIVNAFADGRQVLLTSGMMRFAVTDKELAMVVSHEIAHNIMGHVKAQQTNEMGGLLLDVVFISVGIPTNFARLARQRNSADFEAEADYVGLYLMARAGMEIDGAEAFWRRMAVENPGSISHSSTHPATPERYLAIGTAVEEIHGKLRRGEPLLPELQQEEDEQQEKN